jgi:prepilin-type N-terminal cleavage/methylation domain-containing protein
MRRNQGFTITELMIAVVIIGVLASLAIPGFTSYIYKARVTEATNFLGEVKQRQESYRNEFGQYCDVSAGITSFYPSTLPGADPVTWDSSAATNWDQLGAAPDGPIRFQYSTIAGFPGDSPPSNTPVNDEDHWFIGRARGDLDDDGTDFYLEIYSQTNQIYNSAGGKGGWK